MLSPADAALAARDPAIPGLAVLLDPEAFAAALRSALPGAGLAAVEPQYVRYKPATNCLVAYSAALPAGPATIYARAYAPALGGKLARAERLRGRPGALGVGGIALAEHVIAVYSWPHDEELPALAEVAGPEGRARVMATICPGRDDLPGAALAHLRYRPQRRYVGRLTGARGQALLKLYCADDYGLARAAAAAFRPEGPLDVVAPLGRADEARALVFPWRKGLPLAGMLWGARADLSAVRLTGAALATLHQQAAALPEDVADTPGADLAATVGALTSVCPELEGRLRGLAAGIAAGLKARPARLRPIHGDFYADQVLVGPARATLLDLDNARWGEPAADLGNFIAHLLRAAALGQGTAERAVQLGEALCEGYAEVAQPPGPERVGLYSALGLLRLAPEPFRYRAAGWPERVAAIVAAAELALGGAEPGGRAEAMALGGANA